MNEGDQPPLSLMQRLVGVFIQPDRVFEEVADSKMRIGNVLVPVILLVMSSMILLQVAFQDPVLRQEFSKILASLSFQDTPLSSGSESPFEQPNMIIFLMGQIGGFVVMFALATIFLAGMSLLYWLVGKSAMNANAPYFKVTEVVGLSWLVFNLELIVTISMIMIFRSLTVTPSAALFLHDFDFTNKFHVALARLNPFTIWFLAVLSLGLSKIFNRDFPKVLVLITVLWVLWSLVNLV